MKICLKYFDYHHLKKKEIDERLDLLKYLPSLFLVTNNGSEVLWISSLLDEIAVEDGPDFLELLDETLESFPLLSFFATIKRILNRNNVIILLLSVVFGFVSCAGLALLVLILSGFSLFSGDGELILRGLRLA